MDTAVFSVTGMHCASCGMLVDDAVEDVVGVVESRTDVKRKRTTVTYDSATTTPSTILAAISGTGYDASPTTNSP